MSNLEKFGEWIATLAVASLAWVSGALAIDLPLDSTMSSMPQAPIENQRTMVMRWAQQVDEPPIEQVGEDPGEDVEPLDEAGPPAVDIEPTDDTELLDQGDPPMAEGDDIELLDQGAPPPVVTESPAPETVAVAPATTIVAPVPTAAEGPVLPEGFGTGDVHVAAGTAGFPVGLGDCHVGVVTGRAYVGIDCGDGSSFVGHAPTFEHFPFVLDDTFPFGEDSVFAGRGVDGSDEDVQGDVETLVSASQGAPLDDNETAPVIRTTGNSSVEFTQRARDREARVAAESAGSKRSKDQDEGARGEVDMASADDDSQTRAEGKNKKLKRDKDKNSRASAGDKEKNSKNSKSSKKSKKQGGKKGQKAKKR